METTKNKLPEKVSIFFNNLSKLLEIKLLFYGSVQRDDYFPGDSDIDVDVFTDNVQSTISKMQHFLHIDKSKFKKFVWRLNDENRTLAHGHKVMYRSPDDLFSAEFSIYDEKVKEPILVEHIKKTELPPYASFMLIILKIIYYKLHLLDETTFGYIKKQIMSFMIGMPRDEFVVLYSKTIPIKHTHYDV